MSRFSFSPVRAIALSTCIGLSAAQYSSLPNSSLPIVDLGYELHQANYYNSTGNFYNFSNIRYAAPPLGELRFQAPQAPAVNRSSVDTGSVGHVCPQANTAWGAVAGAYIPTYLAGLPLNYTALAAINASAAAAPLPANDARTTEDCLFLDVLVPQQILESAGNGYGAPVLVWIYGGGYTAGDKSASSYQPPGLISASENNGVCPSSSSSNGVIYVALNYRLGAFGWLSGPTLEFDGTANAGLHDQRFALEWVQDYIHLFGGDPNRVTVFGESAGGGSIMHQITAYGGLLGVPFQQAIPQSPGFFPISSNYAEEQTTQEFLSLLNVSTIEEARQLPSDTLITASAQQVYASPYGQFIYGPTVDGWFVPDQPSKLLAEGHFAKNVNVMVGHNADEGLLFTSPFIQSDSDFVTYLQTTFPGASPAVVQYLAETLYPPVFDGTYPYTDEISRAAFLISESVFVCNTIYLDEAYNNLTHAYLFAVYPALHGMDIGYTFYNGASGINATVARTLQDFITSFAELGRPVSPPGIPYFSMYGPNASVIHLNISSIRQIIDPGADARCLWWQKALFN